MKTSALFSFFYFQLAIRTFRRSATWSRILAHIVRSFYRVSSKLTFIFRNERSIMDRLIVVFDDCIMIKPKKHSITDWFKASLASFYMNRIYIYLLCHFFFEREREDCRILGYENKIKRSHAIMSSFFKCFIFLFLSFYFSLSQLWKVLINTKNRNFLFLTLFS